MEVEAQIREWLKSKDLDNLESVSLEKPPHRRFGDLACSLPLNLAKRLKKPPMEIAEEIASSVELGDLIGRVEAAPPGYVNFFVDFEELAHRTISSALTEGMYYGSLKIGKEVKVQIEHTSVNPNKAIHIGHARNISLGTALTNLLGFVGYGVEVMNFIDDTGTQIADIAMGFLHLGFDYKKPGVKFDQYCGDEVYVKVTRMLEDSDELMKVRADTAQKIDEGGNEVASFAKEIANRVLRQQLATCWRLGAEYDALIWESDILRSRLWENGLEEIKKMGILRYESEGKHRGCWVVKLKEIPEYATEEDKVLIKSDGTKTYVAKDIPFAMWKMGKLSSPFRFSSYTNQPSGRTLWSTGVEGEAKSFGSAHISINVIGSEQARLQKIIGLILSSLYGEGLGENYIHYGYEKVSLSRDTVEKYLGLLVDKEFLHMSGRKGIYFNVDPMLDLLKNMAASESKKRNPDLPGDVAEEIGERIAVSSLKYPLLSMDRDKMVVFDVDKALNITEESGSYILYGYARAQRILEKAETPELLDFDPNLISSQEERNLIEMIAELPLIVSEAAESLNVKPLARYIYRLTLQFNKFYETCPVLSADQEVLKRNRLLLVKAYSQTMENLSAILALPLLKRM
ncbi:MAG: arginine--tRNA ligase [Nitrososphaeria archaeon]|nr:arginine--tRNA ligase [Nitrososphaeria archaeon]